MKTAAALILFLGIGVAWTKADCWETGCQPNHWAVTGCEQYDRKEKGKEACKHEGADGFKYNCCVKGSGGDTDNTPVEGGGFVTEDQFREAVKSSGYETPSRDHYNNFNRYARSTGKISSVEEASMALAQLLHESGGFKYKREIACETTNCPGNYRHPPCDRPNQYYFGRGYIQLTWCYNYGPASTAIFGDDRLLNDPDMVARDDNIAWQTTFWYWAERVHDKPGVQQGHFGATTKAINGIECEHPGNDVARRRFEIYGKVRAAFGLPGQGNPDGCA